MCGVNAIYRRDKAPVMREDLARMNSAISHRGPDGSGFALLNHGAVGLGHVRLSIIDLHAGDQPLYNEDGSVCVVFNGEIYDYKSIREKLLRLGHEFKTQSDTEVIIHLYEEYDLDFFSHLNGEFAFIIWDARKNRMVAARDRCGVKPLFYRVEDKEILFSSEVKGIFSLPRVERRVNPDYFVGPFFAAFPKSISAFEGVQSLRPGHYLTVNARGDVSEAPYWSPEFKVNRSLSYEDARTGVRDLFIKAVQRRLVADVPVGAYLSGGLDSSLVCGIMSESTNRPCAFSIGFSGTAYDESNAARQIAAHFGADFKTVDCNDEVLADNLVKSLYHCEQPLANPNSIAKVVLSNLVHSSGYKVCMTGEGADELFGGYPYFKLEPVWAMMLAEGDLAREGRGLYKEFLKRETRSEGLLWHRSRKWNRKEQNFGYPSYHEMRLLSATYFYRRIIGDKIKSQSRFATPFEYFLNQFDPQYMRTLDPFNATRLISLHQLFSYIIPTLGDRVEMANSVECRTPFLDKDLIEFALTIPPEYFINVRKLAEKELLRKALGDKLPRIVTDTGKHPFMAPNWRSVAKTRVGRELVGEFLSSKKIKDTGLFGPAFIRRLKIYWRVLPKSSPLWKRLDVLAGLILTGQILNHVMVEKPVTADPAFAMKDRSWSAACPAELTV